MKAGEKREICDTKGGETKWLPCLTESECECVRLRSRPRANASCETWSVYLVQESGGKNCAISTADACRQRSNNIGRARVNQHPVGWLYRRGPLICFESRWVRSSACWLSFFLPPFSPTHSRHRASIVWWKNLLARKYRRQTDKTKLDASALRFMNGLFPECTRCARDIACTRPSSTDLSTNSERMLNSDGHWLLSRSAVL